MKERIRTVSGSEYIIDDDAKTWERHRGDNAAYIRSDRGTFFERGIDRGRLLLVCPPFNPIASAAKRVITSTEISEREWLDD